MYFFFWFLRQPVQNENCSLIKQKENILNEENYISLRNNNIIKKLDCELNLKYRINSFKKYLKISRYIT